VPFTPLHLGPAAVFGYLLRRKIHWPTFVAANVLVDVEPLLVFTGVLTVEGYPLHGYLHTFLASLVAGSALGYAVFRLDRFLRGFFERLHLVEGDVGLRGYILGGVLGWSLHVLLDSPLYVDIRPLYPLQFNPLLLPLNFVELYLSFVYVLLLAGLILYVVHAYRESSKKHGRPVSLMQVGVLTVLSSLILLTALEPVSFLIAPILAALGVALLHRGLAEAASRYRRWVKTSLICVTSALAFIVLVQVLIIAVDIVRSRHVMILRDLELFIDTLNLRASWVLFISWALILAGLVLLYPSIRDLSGRFPRSRLAYIYLALIAGWVLILLLVGAVVVIVALVAMAVKILEIEFSRSYEGLGLHR